MIAQPDGLKGESPDGSSSDEQCVKLNDQKGRKRLREENSSNDDHPKATNSYAEEKTDRFLGVVDNVCLLLLFALLINEFFRCYSNSINKLRYILRSAPLIFPRINIF